MWSCTGLQVWPAAPDAQVRTPASAAPNVVSACDHYLGADGPQGNTYEGSALHRTAPLACMTSHTEAWASLINVSCRADVAGEAGSKRKAPKQKETLQCPRCCSHDTCSGTPSTSASTKPVCQCWVGNRPVCLSANSAACIAAGSKGGAAQASRLKVQQGRGRARAARMWLQT